MMRYVYSVTTPSTCHSLIGGMASLDFLVNDIFMQNSTLEKEKLKSGDILLIEEGKLPPKVDSSG